MRGASVTGFLSIKRAGPGMTVQDLGRPGFLDFGLSRGGAVDKAALFEGATLLNQSPDCAAIEMPQMGGAFVATQDLRIALTGAEMDVRLEDQPLVWNASHLLPKAAQLSIGAVRTGSYGYLHIAGGILANRRLGARSAHLAAGIGSVLRAGQELPVGPDTGAVTGQRISPVPRFGAGEVRIVPSLQTHLFANVLERFEQTEFTRDMRGNRMGVRMAFTGDGFAPDGALGVLSEVITPGDIQITGNGVPFVLLSECQTTGGYPRIGTVLPCDIPRVAQARPGEVLRFRFVDQEEAIQAERSYHAIIKGLAGTKAPLIRDPHDIGDLLSYQLISGMIAGTEEEIE